MIIWDGHGYLVAVFVFMSSLLMELGTESSFGDDDFYQREAWPLALALAIAGLLSFLVGLLLSSRGQRRVQDVETGERLVIPPESHSLFFLRMHWWGPLLILIAVVVFVLRLVTTDA